MSGLAFISYRRDDTGPLAHSVYLQLKAGFGSGQLFMDVNSIATGSKWPDRIKDQLESASVVLALIGPRWLRAHDQYGRRRLDAADDWVRLELERALASGKPVVNVLVGETQMPPPEGLPTSLVGLAELQCTQIRTQPQWWERDIADLGQRLLGFGLTRLEDRGAAPPPLAAKQSLPGLTEAELTEALHELPDWEPVADALAAEYPLVRQELRRNLAFANFTEAVAFMAYAAPVFEEANHHPRWGNEWNRVQIRLSTWDAMNKITTRDVEVAKLVEDAYRRFQQRDEGE